MEREYDWSKAPKVGDIIKKVYFQDEEITRSSTMIRCDCRVVKVDEEVGSIYLMATENMFKERPFDGIHTWKAKFSVGNYLYRAESIGCLDLEAFDEICRENPEYLDLGFDYWTSEYDTDDNMAYFITSYGNLDKADRRGIKKCPLPFFVFDPEYYEAVTDNTFGTALNKDTIAVEVIHMFVMSSILCPKHTMLLLSDNNSHYYVARIPTYQVNNSFTSRIAPGAILTLELDKSFENYDKSIKELLVNDKYTLGEAKDILSETLTQTVSMQSVHDKVITNVIAIDNLQKPEGAHCFLNIQSKKTD